MSILHNNEEKLATFNIGYLMQQKWEKAVLSDTLIMWESHSFG